MLNDQNMISMDNQRARQVQDQQAAIRDRQRQILRDENMQLMNNKRNRDDFDRSQDRLQYGTSPHAIGQGYGSQLAAMQEKDRQKNLQMQQFSANVGSPARQKQLQDEYNKAQTDANTNQMLNQRAAIAADYQ